MLHHAQRQLLSRCSLRYYSVSAVSGDAVAASGTSGSPRTRRPSASSFGGISIENVTAPTKSQGFRGRPSRPSWGDGLVTFSFSNRLKMHQKQLTRPDTAARPEDRERRQQSKPRQRSAQMQGGQQEKGTGSRAPRSRDASAAQTRRPTSANAKPRTTSMTTRSPTSRLNNSHAQPKSPSTTAPPDAKGVPAPTNAAAAPAVRAARLTALSSTNLDALFRTRDTPVAGTPLPAYASMTARVRSVLERSAGDYSRFLPRTVGVRKSPSSPPALRTARHALAAQRDVSLAQRRVALHIIGGLAQPGRQVSA
ncbi:hypothetical protein EDB86DRAFT_3104941 [Lactarius hatsudake]|nr:hypothetical protein EDB86DRAFT_3104941 [Lactarius hatsudake]